MPTIYDTVTANIVRAIENGAGEWRMPWHQRAAGGTPIGNPTNAQRGYAYRGANVLHLWIAAQAMGYPTGVWATYRQWEAMGCQVRKGEKGAMSVFWKRTEGRTEQGEDGEETKTRGGLIARAAFVFNAAQVDGYTAPEAAAPSWDPLAAADAFIANTGARIIHGGSRAYYSPSQDHIGMPDRAAFREAHGYYATALHELGHWTGHASRCSRDFSGRFGSEAYAMEELVAELSAAFSCAALGLSNEPRPDHAQYLASWLKVLKADSRAIFTVASRAQAATDHLRSLQPAPREEVVSKPAPVVVVPEMPAPVAAPAPVSVVVDVPAEPEPAPVIASGIAAGTVRRVSHAGAVVAFREPRSSWYANTVRAHLRALSAPMGKCPMREPRPVAIAAE